MTKNKICLMSGAFLNAGDFLIERRAVELIKRFMPEYEVNVLKRLKVDYSDRLDLLSQHIAILFIGGPIYQSNIYPQAIPFVNIDKLGAAFPPIFFIGSGCKCNAYNGWLSESSKAFFNLGTKHHVPLGCRDVYTYRFLRHQGFDNVMMTGCPAWYHQDYIWKEDFRIFDGHIKKICVSEPARATNVPILRELIIYLHGKYPDAEVAIVNHREEKTGVKKIIEELSGLMKLSYINISGSADGFSYYDDCDLHVGFRVHAHIYNLSIRNYSILINEDVRGKGVNESLGLENIDIERPSYREKHLLGNFYLTKYDTHSNVGKATINHIDDFIWLTESADFKNFREAFRRMKLYFGKMEEHFALIKEYIQERNKIC